MKKIHLWLICVILWTLLVLSIMLTIQLYFGLTYKMLSYWLLLTLMLIIQWTGLGVIDRAEEASLNCTKEQKKYER